MRPGELRAIRCVSPVFRSSCRRRRSVGIVLVDDNDNTKHFVGTVIRAVAFVAIVQGGTALAMFVIRVIEKPVEIWIDRGSSFSFNLFLALVACLPVIHLAEMACGIGMWRKKRWAVPGMLIWCCIAATHYMTMKVRYWVNLSTIQLPLSAPRRWSYYDLSIDVLGVLQYFAWLLLFLIVLRSKAVRDRFGSTAGGGFEVLPVVGPQEIQNSEEH